MASSERHEDGASKLLSFGVPLASGLAGAVATVTLDEPFAGPPAAALATSGLLRVGEAVSKRWLAPRQAERTATALDVAYSLTRERIAVGDEPRPDWFGQAGSGDEPSEIIEHALIVAADSAEQKKAPILGRLIANLAFTPEVSKGDGHQLIGLAQRLSYRQLLMLSIFGSKAVREGPLLFKGADVEAGLLTMSSPIGAELLQLRNEGLIGMDHGTEYARPFEDEWEDHETARRLLTGGILTEHGALLRDLGDLARIGHDVEAFLQEFVGAGR